MTRQIHLLTGRVLPILAILVAGCGAPHGDTSEAEASYQKIKAIIGSLQRAGTLPGGTERTKLMNAFINEDHLGVLCLYTTQYLSKYGQTDKHVATVQKIAQLVTTARGQQPCQVSPMTVFDAQEFTRRLAPAAQFLSEVKALTLE